MFTVLTIAMIVVAWGLRDGAKRKNRDDEMALMAGRT